MSGGKRILLTGGAGVIGSHLAGRLLRRGCELTIVDDFNDYYDPRLKEANIRAVRKVGAFRLARRDIRDGKAMERLFASAKPDVVIHLAARAGVRPSLADPALYAGVNVIATIRLLELARRFGVRKFLFGSSSSVYGETKVRPFREDAATIRPVSPYGFSKLSGEYYAKVFHALHGMNVTCLRFFTVYGPRQRPDMAIHKFIRAILRGKEIAMFGRGDTSRDYTYVDDIVRGVVAAVDRCRGLHTYNLGDSRGIALRDLVALIERATGRKARMRRVEEQAGDGG